MNLVGKKLLVLGGTSYMPFIKEYALQERFEINCAGGVRNDILERYADKFFLIEATDRKAIEKLVIDEKIDGIVSLGNENLIDATIDITQQTNLPFYINRFNWNNIQDKKSFKQHCRDFGIDVVEEFDINELSNSKIRYPVVVKPTDGSGSNGVTICYNAEDTRKAVEKAILISRSGQYIIEEYILAPEFIATYIIKNGEPTIWMLGDRYMNRLQEGFGGISNCSVFPSIHSERFITDVHPKLERLLKKYGPANGTFFVQGFAVDGGFKFFDPALRFCGTLDIIPYKKIIGINPLHWMIDHSLTGIMDRKNEMSLMDWKLNGKCVVQLSLHVEVGTIKSIKGLDTIEEFQEVIDVVQLLFEGDVIDKPGTLQQVVARIFIVSEDFKKVTKIIESIYNMVTVLNSEGSNMLMPFKPYGLNLLF